MERTLGMEIVQAIAEVEDKDSVLQRYLDGDEGDTTSQLLVLLSAHQEHNEAYQQ
jgi:hypothetical protein